MSKKEREPLTIDIPQQTIDDDDIGTYRGRYFGTLSSEPKYAQLGDYYHNWTTIRFFTESWRVS